MGWDPANQRCKVEDFFGFKGEILKRLFNGGKFWPLGLDKSGNSVRKLILEKGVQLNKYEMGRFDEGTQLIEG